MLSEKDFDDWACTYDESVERTNAADAYPFAGYDHIMDAVFQRVTAHPGARVLDLGFGTASLTKRLYDAGYEVYGQDFSPRMVEVAQEKMPNALLIHRDFSSGLAPELARRTYDAIVATYSLHHLDDKSKRNLIDSLLPRLSERGCLYIGDVAFETRQELERCRAAAGDAWDPDEIYFVYDEFRGFFPAATFERVSPCSGIIIIPGVKSQLNEV